jgi:hypothetical protein
MNRGIDTHVIVGFSSGLIVAISVLFFHESPVFAVITAAAIATEAWQLSVLFHKQDNLRKLQFIMKGGQELFDSNKIYMLNYYGSIKDEELKEKLLGYSGTTDEKSQGWFNTRLQSELERLQFDSRASLGLFILVIVVISLPFLFLNCQVISFLRF